MVLVAFSLVGLGLVKNLWPGFGCVLLGNGISVLPILNTPLLVDYVSKESIGLVVSIQGAVQTGTGGILNLLIVFQKSLNATASQLIILAAGIVLIFNMVLMCMLTDIRRKPKMELET